MEKRRIIDTPHIKVWNGYKLEEVLDTDDTGFDNGESLADEEVILDYERD